MRSEHDRALLLGLAREAIAAHVGEAFAHVAVESAVVLEPGGAFVTLHDHGELRGCIGHIEPDQPLGDVIRRCAVAAAASDPRFPPITADELRRIRIEISLLGPLERISGSHDVVVGKHGLVVQRGWQRGLLLPQVALEWKWDAEMFLSQTCYKAGLPRDAWKHGGIEMWRFEAEVFGEGG